jgi:probable rRNA maturation factor
LVILQKRVAGMSGESLNRFLLRARRAAGVNGAVNVLVTTSAAVRTLNRRFRGKDKATDVLSFPSPSDTSGRKDSRFTGDIAISADIAAQNAARLGHAVCDEVKILTLHGILHLAGYDHERDNGSMARKEAKLRRALGLPASLIERAAAADPEKIERVRQRKKAAARSGR